jgi:RNA polymerase sigma-70 factor (ECF subfamily)|nr:RNA polymerase sigma factor [Kofleriaceae bacterium]
MAAKPTPAEPVGQVVPLRRLDERKAALSEISDEALLAACGVGDSAALGALFDRHHDAVYRLLSRLLRRERSEIDDLVQLTFMAAWRASKKYDARGSVRSFLFGIAANTVRHHIRGATRRRAAHAAHAELPEPAMERGPDVAAIRSQQVGRLAAALERLPHDLRVAYVMCDVEDIPGVDAARALDVRAGTLWRRLHEARRALREAIDSPPKAMRSSSDSPADAGRAAAPKAMRSSIDDGGERS